MPAADPEKVLATLLRNPRAAAQALVKYDAEKSLLNYSRLMWKALDPGSPLRVGWAYGAICEHLEAVSRGQIRNLLINLPPGFSKSTLTGVMWPSWEWGPQNRPDLRILSWSYSDHLTARDNDKTRILLTHPLYEALWGDRVKLKKDQNAKKYFKNSAEGWKIASTIKGMGTGERGDRLILDDPHSVEKADSDAERNHTISWFGGTMSSRVRNANAYPELIDGIMVEPSRMVVIMQRVHRYDVSGTILDLIAQGYECEHLMIEMEYEGKSHPVRASQYWKGSSIGWVDPREALLNTADTIEQVVAQARGGTFRQQVDELDPMGVIGQSESDKAQQTWSDFVDVWGRITRDRAMLADPDRFARPTVEEKKLVMRRKLGSNAVASQFRQWPYESGGLLFQRENFVYCDLAQVPNEGREARGWDLAASDAPGSDQTASVRMKMTSGGHIYVLDARAVRLTPGKVDDHIVGVLKGDGFSVVQSFPQDPGSAGKMVVNHIARKLAQGYRFRSSPETHKKGRRAEPLASQVEHKNVYIVRGPWNSAFVDELVEFPHGKHDDFVDAASRAYDALLQTQEMGEMVAPKLFR